MREVSLYSIGGTNLPLIEDEYCAPYYAASMGVGAERGIGTSENPQTAIELAYHAAERRKGALDTVSLTKRGAY